MPLAEAKISILDIGLLRGYGIYDGLSVINGRVLRFFDHWQRFERGAKALNLKIPVTKEILEQKILEITEKSGFSKRSNIRLILTGGPAIGGIEYDFEQPTFYAIAEKWNPLPNEYFQKGVKLVTYEYQREMAEIKTTNYVTAVNLQNFRKESDALEILYIHKGLVLECATSNIFIVKDGVVITPVENVLEGITSKIVQELASDGYKLERRNIRVEELKSLDEVFITSSFKDVVPVTTIDDYTVGSGEVGPVTKDVMNRFTKYLS